MGNKKYLMSASALSKTTMARHDAQLEAGEYVLVPVVLGTRKVGAAKTGAAKTGESKSKMVVALNSSKPLLVKEVLRMH